MDVGFRTLTRGFLLVGGLFFLTQGAIDGSAFDLGLGAAATLLGGVGLWWELRGGAGGDDSMDNL